MAQNASAGMPAGRYNNKGFTPAAELGWAPGTNGPSFWAMMADFYKAAIAATTREGK
jgi:hypothetical protein